MKIATKRFLSILISILLLVGALFIYSSLIRPAYSEIKGLRSEVATRLRMIAEYKEAISQIQKVLEDYQDVFQLRETISLILPNNQNLAQAVYQLNGLAGINKLTIDKITSRVLAIKPSIYPDLIKGVGTLRISFTLSGNYENFKSFIHNLETNMTLMDLADLKIEPVSRARIGENNFFYMATIDTYYQIK